LLVIDAIDGVTEQDARIAGYAHENGKGMIIIVNKWDLVDKDNTSFNKYIEEVRNKLAYLEYAPILTMSALTGQRSNKVLEMINEVMEFRNLRISTGVLNDIITESVLMNPPRTVKGKRLKILYATQVSVAPPKFVVFCNDSTLVHFSYVRYLENKIRENYEYKGNPVIIEFKNRGE